MSANLSYLRNLISILCVGLLILHSYGNILNYMHCRMMALITGSAATCDCQKQANDDPAGSVPFQKTLAKGNLTDPQFIGAGQAGLKAVLKNPIRISCRTGHSTLHAGVDKTIFQPPRF
jgi:hypothetical protein